MRQLIVPLSSPEATDAARFGPKAANLAALGQAGLPIPDGFCLDARGVPAASGGARPGGDGTRGVRSDRGAEARRHALQMKLGLLEQPITPEVLEPLLAAWRDLVDRTGALTVVRSSALVEDRFGSSFAGQFESYLGLEEESEFLTAVRACWARALVHTCAALHGDPRPGSGGHRDGGARPAARAGPRRWRRVEPDGGRGDAGERNLGARIRRSRKARSRRIDSS